MRFPYVVLLSASALMWTATLLAQSPNGVINGLVVDPSTGIIVGADVIVVNDVTGVRYTTKTNGEGIYVLPNLPPGPYRLQVSKIGFKTIIKPDIVLNLQDALSINFTLPIGASYESVTVEAGASMINTTDASVSTVIDHTYVENMPLNGRSFQDLILLTPGTTTQTPQISSVTGSAGLGVTGEFSVNGQRTESNNYTVDGVSANVGIASGSNGNFGAGGSGSLPAATALGTTQALVSVDDLKEFRVQSSTYSAEYGRYPGGQFGFETKSGTNHFHGTAFDYLRNGSLDAQDWFNDYFGVPEPALRQNDFGGTFGGPVDIPALYRGRGKTFFFASYEGLRLTAPQAASANFVPDLCMRGTGACPPGRNPAPSVLQPVLSAFPVPSPNGLEDAPNGIAQYIGGWSNPASIDSTSVRFDHAASDRLKIFFRFSDTGSSSATRLTYALGGTPSIHATSTSTLRTFTGGASSVFKNDLSNEVRLNYSSNGAASNDVIDAFGDSKPVNLAELANLSSESRPLIFLLYGGYQINLYQREQSGAQKQWNLVDTVNLFLGRHRFKFGADYRRLTPLAIPDNPFVPYYYLSEASVEENTAYVFPQVFAPAYPLYKNLSIFGQDEWRVTSRLSISVGLRWDVNPAPGVTQGLKPYTVQGTDPNTWRLAPQGTPLWRTTWFNFAPRLGAAFIVRNTTGWETVVRGGGGLFFDTGQQLGSLGFLGPGYYAAGAFQQGSFPGSIVVPTIVNPPVAPYTVAYGFAPHLQLPYTLQWNVSVEQALSKWQSLTASYVGSHAARLLERDLFYPSNNPNSSTFYFIENGLTSDYDALQIQFRRRLSRGLTALGSYTWSHCIDYGSENLSYGYQRGNCDFDVRHSFSGALSYDLPDVRHNGILKVVLHNWGVDDRFTARTGFPVTLHGNGLVQPDGRVYDEGLNLVPGQPSILYGANCVAVLQELGELLPGQGCPGGRAINPNGFADVSSGLGNAPRNFATLFGAWQMDLAIRREFPVHETLKLQFRAETFNVFNHPNFGTVDAFFGDKTFGQATSTLASSLGVLNPLYQMGGPRSMQFALKLIF